MRLIELQAPTTARNFVRGLPLKRSKIQGEDPEYLELLQRYGFTLAGPTGVSGAVFRKQGYPYVLKIFGYDHGYIEWYKYCKENQSNPYLPKVKGGLLRIDKFVFGVRLEPLEYKSDLIQIECYRELRDLINSGRTSIEPGEYTYFVDDPQLFSVIKQIREFTNYHELDMHEGNVMWRGDQIVITDPLV